MHTPKYLQALLPGRDRGMWLVVVPHAWGRGPTIGEATQQCRRSGGTVRKTSMAVLYCADPDAQPYVDELGRTHSDKPIETLYRKGI